MEKFNHKKTDDELVSILAASYLSTKVWKLKTATPKNIAFHILSLYPDRLQDKLLNKHLDSIPKDSVMKILSFLKTYRKEENIDINENSTTEARQYAVMNEGLTDVINYLEETYSPDTTTTTSMFLEAILSTSEEIRNEFDSLGFENDKFIDLVVETYAAFRSDTDNSSYDDLANKMSETDEDGRKVLTNPDKFFSNILNQGILKEKRLYQEQNIQNNLSDKRKKELKEFEEAGIHEELSGEEINPDSKTPNLDKFSFDMTSADKRGKYDPIVGRETEIDQIIKILCCRIKNNAILLGEPGVGKTAIVEALANRINQGKVPEELKNKRICSLDLNALVSGTKYRGEYEQRLQSIIKEVTSCPDVIIYIDEFHNLVGNGSTAGSGDGANILKPYLARGEFRCLGSTTTKEYRNFVEKDASLKRRFQEVHVDEPSNRETLNILKKIVRKYEDFHKVIYPTNVLEDCVEWSARYITDKHFPDKAIDCLDRAGTTAALRNNKPDDNLDKLAAEIKNLSSNKVKLVAEQNFEEAAKYRDKILAKEKELDKLKQEQNKNRTNRKFWGNVSSEDIANEISKISKVPLDKIRSVERERIGSMRKVLSSKVVGQDEAVEKITKSLQKNIMGFRDTTKPIASFLLCGSTGTGKSYISKIVAKEFFGSEDALVRIDCGEFTDGKASLSKLTGATPGYIGYEDEPLLEKIKYKPFSVLLVDEVDKVTPEAFNIFMNILDEGYCVLGNGCKVDFRNTIIIFTGNVGTKELQNNVNLGLSIVGDRKETDEKIVKKSISKFFRPEFLNRLTDIIVFNTLTKTDMRKIFTIEFNKVKKRVSENGYTVKVNSTLRDHIIDSCDLNFGARDLKRNIDKFVVDKLVEAVMNDEKLNSVTLDWKKDKVIVV